MQRTKPIKGRDTQVFAQTGFRGFNPILGSLQDSNTRAPSSIAYIIMRLKGDDGLERHKACEDLVRLANGDLEEAKKALPTLTEAFGNRSEMTKAVVAETYMALVELAGNPRDVMSAKALQQLMQAANEAEKKARLPSVIDRESEVERFRAILKRIVLPRPVANPQEE
jgi:ATP-dependent Clp protease ATP-binding subunit ClpA